MVSSGGRPQSTRLLAIIVALFALLAFMMMAFLAAILVTRPGDGPFSGSLVTAAPTVSISADVDHSSPKLAVAEHSDGQAKWPEVRSVATPSPLMAKPVVAGGDERVTWTATPIPTNTPVPTPTPNPTFVSSAYGLGDYMPEGLQPNEKWVDVNVTEQKLVAYEGLIPVFETLVSTGTDRYPTVTGQFRIWLRFRSQDMNGYRLGYDYYLRNVPYVQYFYEDYALHGTFWHTNFGRPMSHGCVNLSPSDAEWLYNWAGYGTLVNVHP